MTCQIASRRSRISALVRQACSFSSMSALIEQPVRGAQAKQLRRAEERVGQGRVVGLDPVGARRRLVDHEPAADRVVAAARARPSASKAVRASRWVVGQASRRWNTRWSPSCDLRRPSSRSRLALAHLAPSGRDRVGVDRLRLLALQAQDHRLVAAVAAPVAPSEPNSSTLTRPPRSSSPAASSRLRRSAPRAWAPPCARRTGRCRS